MNRWIADRLAAAEEQEMPLLGRFRHGKHDRGRS